LGSPRQNGGGQKGDFREACLDHFVHSECMKITIFLVLTALAGSFSACTTTTHHTMKTSDDLIGTWTCVSAVVDGKPLPPEIVSSLRLTLTENRYKTEKASEVLFDSTYSIDTTREPNEIDMLGTEGELTGKQARGIFSVENETLRICYTMPGMNRPTRFESDRGSKASTIVWKRL
jgi:uncharacterized protein (TIGR03067 family)